DMRSRNKQATREAIGGAALRLAVELGPEGVRVHDIAEAAGVSARTYNNYFGSREEAICALQAQRARKLEEAIRARPADDPLDQPSIAALATNYAAPDPDKVGLHMMMPTPMLEGEALKTFTGAEEPLAQVIAERTGTDPASDVFPAALAAAVAGAT